MKFNLKEFFGFCKHKWKEKEKYKVIRKYIYTGELVPNCFLFILECVKCGKLKRVDIP